MAERRDLTVLALLAGAAALFWPRGSKAAEKEPIGIGGNGLPPPPEEEPPGPRAQLDLGPPVEEPPPRAAVDLGPALPDVDALERIRPTVGAFYQVRKGDTFFGRGPQAIAYNALVDFARGIGMGEEEAASFARAHRVQYVDLILCSGWNDLLYGTWGYGSKAHAGPHGRSIRLIPKHADNRDRLSRGEPPLRVIQMRTPSDKRRGNAGAVDRAYVDGYEYLWLPGLNPEEAASRRVLTAEGAAWPDGSSVMNPPPEVYGLDFQVLEDPDLGTYGCVTGGADGRVSA